MDVIIIGGGIGGLTLALGLHAAGTARRIRLYEAAPEIHPLGVGINLGPHAIKELSALGLQDALTAIACQPQDYAFFTRHGQLVYREPWGMAAGHQWPHISIHRADLHKVLLDATIARLGAASFITGHRCTGIAHDDSGVTARASHAAASRCSAGARAGSSAARCSMTAPRMSSMSSAPAGGGVVTVSGSPRCH